MNKKYVPIMAILFASLMLALPLAQAVTGYYYWSGGTINSAPAQDCNVINHVVNAHYSPQFFMPNIANSPNNYYGFITWHEAFSGIQDCQAIIINGYGVKNGYGYTFMLAELWWDQPRQLMRFAYQDFVAGHAIFSYVSGLTPAITLQSWYILVYGGSTIHYEFWYANTLRAQVTVGLGGFGYIQAQYMTVGDPDGTYGGSALWNGVQANWYP